MRAKRAVLSFSLKKKEACFFKSRNEGVPMPPMLLRFLLIIDISLQINSQFAYEAEGESGFQLLSMISRLVIE